MNSKWIIIFYVIILHYTSIAQRCNTVSYESQDHKPELKLQARHGSIAIQCVFHIVYRDNVENIPDARIFAQIDILNSIFDADVAANNSLIPEEFRKLAANPQIHFCLADVDPNGNFTNGIIRKKTNIQSIGCRIQNNRFQIMDSNLGGSTIWDPSRYLNIFIGNRDDCPIAEAIFPALASTKSDGIIADPRCVGPNIKFWPYHKGYTIVHEVGHYFGLKHLTESNDPNDCSQDDGIDDTPLQSVNYFGCPEHPQFSCGVHSMFMNYMSLVNDDCMQLFTMNQVARMKNQIGVYRPYFLFYSCDKADQNSINDLIVLPYQQFWVLRDKHERDWSADLILYNTFGQMVWCGKHQGAEFKLITNGITNFSNGVYYLLIKQKNENRVIKLPMINY